MKEDLRVNQGDLRGGTCLVVIDDWLYTVLCAPRPGNGRAYLKVHWELGVLTSNPQGEAIQIVRGMAGTLVHGGKEGCQMHIKPSLPVVFWAMYHALKNLIPRVLTLIVLIMPEASQLLRECHLL